MHDAHDDHVRSIDAEHDTPISRSDPVVATPVPCERFRARHVGPTVEPIQHAQEASLDRRGNLPEVDFGIGRGPNGQWFMYKVLDRFEQPKSPARPSRGRFVSTRCPKRLPNLAGLTSAFAELGAESVVRSMAAGCRCNRCKAKAVLALLLQRPQATVAPRPCQCLPSRHALRAATRVALVVPTARLSAVLDRCA